VAAAVSVLRKDWLIDLAAELGIAMIPSHDTTVPRAMSLAHRHRQPAAGGAVWDRE